MTYVFRELEPKLEEALTRGKSVLLMGPRQTGKTTTLLSQITPHLSISLLSASDRLRYEHHPATLEKEIRSIKTTGSQPLIVIDEIQKAPQLLDTIQLLIDQKVAQFVLTGSSARKLRRQKANMLPGRVILLRLDPFLAQEYPETSLTDKLYYGDLPGVVTTENPMHRDAELASYVTTYLDEEIQAEAAVRRIGTFHQFLQLAAMESGKAVHFSNLSQDLGVSANTVQAYYQILEDCLIAERVTPFTKSKTRKTLAKTAKFLFFDLCVRRLAAKEGIGLSKEQDGHLFKHWVGLELIRLCRLKSTTASIHFWRDHNGPEVDWILQYNGQLTAIEVKWTEKPTPHDCRHLHTFLTEYPACKFAFLVCNIPRSQQLSEKIMAIPWRELDTQIGSIFAI